MKPEYAAHTPRDAKDPHSPWHELLEHLETVAKDAAVFASKFGASEIAHWAGMLHDAGKFSSAFRVSKYTDDSTHAWKCHNKPQCLTSLIPSESEFESKSMKNIVKLVVNMYLNKSC